MAWLGLRDSDLCWRCDASCGTLLHMLYSHTMIDFQLVSDDLLYQYSDVLYTDTTTNALCLAVVLNAHQISCCRTVFISRCWIVLQHWKTKGDISVRDGLTTWLRFPPMKGSLTD